AAHNEDMRRLRNSWWFLRSAYRARAKIHYGDIYNLPAELGRFDVAVLASVLLHVRDPLRVVEQCARLADRIIIVDMHRPDLEGRPVMLLEPDQQNFCWHTWWRFSTDLLKQFLEVQGFAHHVVTTSEHEHLRTTRYTLFTLVSQANQPR